MGTWGDLEKVNCGSLDVTLAQCTKVMGSFLPQSPRVDVLACTGIPLLLLLWYRFLFLFLFVSSFSFSLFSFYIIPLPPSPWYLYSVLFPLLFFLFSHYFYSISFLLKTRSPFSSFPHDNLHPSSRNKQPTRYLIVKDESFHITTTTTTQLLSLQKLKLSGTLCIKSSDPRREIYYYYTLKVCVCVLVNIPCSWDCFLLFFQGEGGDEG